MKVSLPTFKQDGNSNIQVAEKNSVRKPALMSKHSPTITRLKQKLGIEKDETVIAWLLEQIKLSPDLDKAIGKLLEN